MSEYMILTESTTDLPVNLIDELNITVIPMIFNIDGKEYRNYPDGHELGFVEFFSELKQGKSASTSQINTGEFIDIFEPYLKEGKDILYIAFSSALSGTYNSSVLAIEDLKEKYPDRKIYAVDSLGASMGEGLLVYHAAKLRDSGKTIEEVNDWLIDNRLKLCLWFTVDDLNHLKRGGRVSATAALIGTVLGIKPILHVDNQGRLIPMSKVRGRNQSIEALADKVVQTGDNTEDQVIFISHGDCLEDAKKVGELIKEKVKVKDVFYNFIGPVIGAHSGPGTIALFFLGSAR